MQSLSAEVLEKKTIECCQCILYFCYKQQRLIHFVKIPSSNFSGNEFLVKMYKLLKNSTFKINIISKTTISKEFNYLMQYELNTTGISKRDLDWPELFHQKRKQAISFSRTLFCYSHFDMDFIFSTYLFIYMNIFFKFILSNIESQMPNYDRSLNSTTNVYIVFTMYMKFAINRIQRF